MRPGLTRVAGPVLLLGSVAAVWLGVGLGPLATPQTQQAATAREVAAPTAPRPTEGVVLALRHDGDRLVLMLRTGTGSSALPVAPGVQVVGATLPDLVSGSGTHVRLDYDAGGTVVTITRA